MGNTLKVRATGDTSELNGALQMSAREVKELKRTIEDLQKGQRKLESQGKKTGEAQRKMADDISSAKDTLKTMKDTVGMATAAIGTAIGVVNTLSQAFNSNYSSQLEFNSTLDGAKDTVNHFFTAITSGDWSIFENGILNAIRLSKEYRKELKKVQNAVTIDKGRAEQIEAQRNNLESTLKSGSKEEKQEALAEYTALANEELEVRQRSIDNSMQAIGKGLDSIGVTLLDTPDKINDAIYNFLSSSAEGYGVLDKFNEISRGLTAQKSTYLGMGSGGNALYSYSDDEEKQAQARRDLEALLNQYPQYTQEFLEQMARFRNFYAQEENLSALNEQISSVNENLDKMGTVKKDLLGAREDAAKVGESLGNGIVAGAQKGKKETREAIEGSLAYLSEQIQQKELDFKYAVNPEEQERLWNELVALYAEKEAFELKYKLKPEPDTNKPVAQEGSLAYMNQQIQELTVLYNYAVDEASREALRQEIEDLQKTKITLELDYKPPKTDNGTLKDMSTQANDAATAIGAIANAFTALGSASEEGGNKALQIFTLTASAISQLIPQIVTLISAKQGEAMASGTASAAKTPYPANILAIASIVGTIAATFAKIPKFANGGIIKGVSNIGDYNIARVNNGEMILNGSQQSNLFRIINSGRAEEGSTHKEVEFKLRGDMLIGLMRNTEKKNRRVS